MHMWEFSLTMNNNKGNIAIGFLFSYFLNKIYGSLLYQSPIFTQSFYHLINNNNKISLFLFKLALNPCVREILLLIK